MELFSLFLKLEGRRCLVVGAGRIAAPKIESLRRCGAKIRVIAPGATARIRQAARSGRLVWEKRAFRDSDLVGAFLVIAATSDPELHEHIFQLARRAGILCNSVDEPSRCDFYYPAVVRRGALQIAISTAGNSPALAKRLRKELAEQFGAAYGPWVENLGKVRAEMMASDGAVGAPPEGRRKKLFAMASENSYGRFRRKRAGRTARASRKRARAGTRKARA